MNEQDKKKAFDKTVKQEAKQLSKIQTQTRDEIVALLKQAYADAVAILKKQPTDYQQWYYPEVKNNIEQALADLGAATGSSATAGQQTAWEAGQMLVDNPFEAAGVAMKVILPTINTAQLVAMQSFMTGKMQDVSAEVLTKINTQLGLTIIGSQGVEDTIKGIQDAETMSRKRATTIVRTELGRAYATASQLRMEQSLERLPNLKKQWRRSGKIHSRRSHDFTDGQIRPVNKPFIIGTGSVAVDQDGKDVGSGPRLMYPHDPKAPISETINCGCMSIPYMGEWKDAGVLKDPGRRAFTDQEIALNPAKADYAAAMEGSTLADMMDSHAIYQTAKSGADYANWADKVLSPSYKARHEFKQIGVFPDFVLKNASVRALKPQSGTIEISDYLLRHGQRPKKTGRNAALSLDDVLRLPEKISTARWVYDQRHKNLIGFFDIGQDKTIGKAVVMFNYNRKGMSHNAVVTTGTVDKADAKAAWYEEIKQKR
jgi:hypothetical protein